MQIQKGRSIHPFYYFCLFLLLCACILVLIARMRYAQNMAVILGQGMSIEDVQRMINKDIPTGSTKNQIEKWFKGKRLRYGYLDTKRGQLKHEPLAKHSGIPLKNLSGILTAVVPGHSGNIIKCHTYMAFIIDREGRSVKHHISGTCSNPVDRIEF